MKRHFQRRGFGGEVEFLLLIAFIGCAVGLAIPWCKSLVAHGYSRWSFLWVFPVSLASVVAYFVGLPLLVAFCFTRASQWINPEDESVEQASRFETVYSICFAIAFVTPVVVVVASKLWQWLA